MKARPGTLLSTLLYSLVLTVVLTLTCSIVYRQAYQKLQNTAIEQSHIALSDTTENISSSLKYMLELFTGSPFQKRLRNSLKAESDVQHSMHAVLYTLQNDIRDFFYQNSYIQDVGLFLTGKDRDYLCTSSIISDNFERDYNNGLYCFDRFSYEEFRALFSASAGSRRIRSNLLTGFVSCNYSNAYSANIGYLIFPIAITDTTFQVYVFVQINMDSLGQALLSSQYAGDFVSINNAVSQIYTTNASNEIHTLRATTYYDNTSKIWYVGNSINELGLNCHISLDNNVIYDSIKPFSRLLCFLFFMVAAIICLLAFFLLRYWFLPIMRTASSIPETSNTGTNLIANIERHIANLAAENHRNASQIKDYRLREFLANLYLGKVSVSDSTGILHQIFPDGIDNFRCLCIGSLEAKGESLSGEQLSGLLTEAGICVSACLELDKIFVCLSPQAETAVYQNMSAFSTLLNNLLQSLNQNGFPIAIGISDEYSDIGSIPVAYKEARASWQSAITWQTPSVICSASLSTYASRYQAGYLQLDSMYQALITGHKEKALEIYDQLVEDNFHRTDNAPIRSLYWQQFTYDVLGVLVRASTRHKIYPIIEAYLSDSTGGSLKRRICLLRDAILEAGEFIPIYDHDSAMADAIQKYCSEHVCDYQLSLSSLGEAFHLSNSSMSKFFKAHFGINFMTYIERLRIKQADTLLLERKLTVKEIAAAVGYQNMTTFYNVYRKNKNCSPTEWRDRQKPPSLGEVPQLPAT